MSTTATVAPRATTGKFATLKKGTVLSETQYYVVDEVKGDKTRLINDAGEPIVVNDEYVNKCVEVADYYTKEEVKNRTELTQIFLAHPFTAMSVNFNKKVDEKAVLADLLNTHQNTAPKDVEKEFKKTLKRALEGEERTAVGRHYGHVNEFGRIGFIDMNKEKGDNPSHDARSIQVDPRTINWLIVKGVKYKLK